MEEKIKKCLVKNNYQINSIKIQERVLFSTNLDYDSKNHIDNVLTTFTNIFIKFFIFI